MAVLASDDFNRANANPIGSPWVGSTNNIQIVSNQVTGTNAGTNNSAYYGGVTFEVDGYVQARLKSVSSSFGGVTFRHSTSAATYYSAHFQPGTSTTYITTWIAGGATDITTSTGITWAINDVMRLEVEGTTLTLFKNGSQVLQGTNGDITAVGQAGLHIYSNASDIAFDDFEAGTLTLPSRPMFRGS